MSTRSIIAIPIEDGAAALGRYHHFDGYPTGLGVALINAYHAHMGYTALVKRLLFDHVEWRSIVAANWDLAPGSVDHYSLDRGCAVEGCDMAHWAHYLQYYAAREVEPPKPDETVQLDHAYVPITIEGDDRPECYCHDDEGKALGVAPGTYRCITPQGSDWCTGEDCEPLFMEWEYRLYPQGIEVWEARKFEDDSTYRHFRRGRVSWDTIMPASVMRLIEDGEDPKGPIWGDQLVMMAESIRTGGQL